jgi:hypothetical protein
MADGTTTDELPVKFDLLTGEPGLQAVPLPLGL